MTRRLSLIILLIFSWSVVFSQKKINISGKIILSGIEIPGAIIELNIFGASKKAISNIKGEFRFTEVALPSVDSLHFKVFYVGYKTLDFKYSFPKSDTTIIFIFKDLENIALGDVLIRGEKKSATKAYKSVYKINSNDFIKNSRGDKVLNTVPNVSLQNNDVIVDGRNKAIIFIDGVEANAQELKSISAEDIDKVEVIDNPSASYNADFTGAVINVVLKKKVNDYFKVSASGTSGIRNNYWSVFPTFAFKRKSFILSSYYSRVNNTQTINYNLNRQSINGAYYDQTSVRKPAGYQQTFNTKMSLDLDSNSKLNFSNEFSGYNFDASTIGFYNSNVTTGDIFFSNRNSIEKQNRWSVSSVYINKLNSKNTIYLKGKFFKYNNIDIFNIVDEDNDTKTGNVKSVTNELTAEADHSMSNIHLFKKLTEIYSGVKIINREFDLATAEFNIHQTSINLFSELNTSFSDKFSSMIGLAFENTKYTNSQLNQHYNYLLPTVNLLYNLGNDLSIKGGYSKKIIRPSADNLNDKIIYVNPGLATQGNRNLGPQIRSYAFITVTKKLNNDRLSFRIYNESVKNAIIETYKTDENVLVSTLENAAKDESLGISLGLTKVFFSTINANINFGLDYNKFAASSAYAIVPKNSGVTTRSNFNVTSNILKKRIALTLYGFYNSPIYTLTTRTITRPYLGFDSETNFFKNKLNLRLSYNNIFSWNAKRNEYSGGNIFNQTIQTRNNTSNLLLSMTYFLGKKFNSSISNTTIDNDDIIVK